MSAIRVGDEVTIGSWGYRWTVMGFKLPGPVSRATKAIIHRQSNVRFPTDGFVGSPRSRAVIRTRMASTRLMKADRP